MDEYITEAVLKSSVAKELSLGNGGAVDIVDVAVADGAGEKENFASVLKAVTLSSSVAGGEDTREHSYMVKHFPTNALRSKNLKEVCTTM